MDATLQVDDASSETMTSGEHLASPSTGEPGCVRVQCHAEYYKLAMSEARRLGMNDVVGFLERTEGASPLHVACKEGRVEVVTFLLGVEGLEDVINGTDESSDASYNGDTPLHSAVRAGIAEIVELLLNSRYCDPNVRTDSEGDTPLMVACKMDMCQGQNEIIELTLSNDKCNPNIQNSSGDTALHIAVEKMSHTVLKVLVSHRKYKPDLVNELNQTPLHLACMNLDIAAVDVLLRNGNCNVNIQNNTGQTPLHLVVGSKCGTVKSKVKFIHLLLSFPDCDPLITDAQGVTPLEIAYKTSHQIFMLILEKGCSGSYSREEEMVEKAMTLTDELLHMVCRSKPNARIVQSILRGIQSHPALINKTTPSTGYTPLHIAVGKGNEEAVKVLLDSQYCDPNVRTKSLRDTPLIVACKVAVADNMFTSYQVISLLLSNDKCDPNIQNNDGNSALHIAVARGWQETFESLLCCERCKLDLVNKDGETPLHIACTRLNVQAVEMLVKNGKCSVNIQTSSGQTPLHLVVGAKHGKLESKVEIVHLLLSFPDCDPLITDAQGVTPLEIAYKTSHQILY